MMVDISAILLQIFFAAGQPMQLAWTEPTHAAPITYNVYRSHNGDPYKLTPHAGIKSRHVEIVAGLQAGVVDCFKITKIESGVESAYSQAACEAWVP